MATRNRSPEYPAVDLETAIKRAQELYEKEAFNWAAVNVAVGHWGYVEGSSSGMRTLAGLRHHGIVEYQGEKAQRKVRLTGLAKRILRDPRPESAERLAAIREAALMPVMYKKVWDEWGPDLPSDTQMTFDLEHTYEFNPNSIASFIAAYKATLHYAGLDAKSRNSDIGEDSLTPVTPASSDTAGSGAGVVGGGVEVNPNPTGKVTMQPLTIPLRRDGTTAVLNAPNPLTKKDLTNLKAWLLWYETSMTDEDNAAQGEDRNAGE